MLRTMLAIASITLLIVLLAIAGCTTPDADTCLTDTECEWSDGAVEYWVLVDKRAMHV